MKKDDDELDHFSQCDNKDWLWFGPRFRRLVAARFERGIARHQSALSAALARYEMARDLQGRALAKQRHIPTFTIGERLSAKARH